MAEEALDFSSYADPPPKEPETDPDEPLDFSRFAEGHKGPEDHSAVTRGMVTGLLRDNPELTGEALEGLSYMAPEELRGAVAGLGNDLRTLNKDNKALEEYKRQSPEHLMEAWDQKGLGGVLTWLGEGLGQGLSSSAPSLITSAGGAFFGKRVAGKPGAIIGAGTGAFSGSYLLNYGEVYKYLKEEGVDPEKASETAMYATVPISALDSIVPGKVITQLGGIQTVKRQVARSIARRILEEGAEAGATEAITEATQEAIKKATGSLETDKPFWTGENVKDIAESGLIGAATGGVLGGAGGVRRDSVSAPETPGDTGETAKVAPEVAAAVGTPEAANQAVKTGNTSTQVKPSEDVKVGNPKSAPKRSKRRYPNVSGQATAKSSAQQTISVEDVSFSLDPAQEIALATEEPKKNVVPSEIAEAVERLAQQPPIAQQSPTPATPEPIAQVTPESNVPTDVAAASQRLQSDIPDTSVTQRVTTPQITPVAPEISPSVPAEQKVNSTGDMGQPLDFSAQAEPVMGQGRVLNDLTPKAQKAVKAQNKRVAENIKELEPVTKTGKNLTKKEKAKLATDETALTGLFEKHTPTENETDDSTLARATQFVTEAEQAGVTIPQRLKGTKTPATVLAVEARDLVRAAKTSRGKKRTEAFIRFRTREAALRAGGTEDVRAERRVEGDVVKKGAQKAVEQVAAPQEAQAETEEAAAVSESTQEVGPSESVPEALNEVRSEHIEKQAQIARSNKGPVRGVEAPTEKRTVKTKEGKEVEIETAAAASGEKLTTDAKAKLIAEMNAKLAGERAIPQQAQEQPKKGRDWETIDNTITFPEEEPLELDQLRRADEDRLSHVRRTAIKELKFGEAAERTLKNVREQLKHPLQRAMFPAFFNRIVPHIQHVPVYVLPHDAFDSATQNPGNRAYYRPDDDIIVVRESVTRDAGFPHTLLHEGIHAAFMKATANSPRVREAVDMIAREFRAARPKSDLYAYTNFDEFIAEAFSNPEFVTHLQAIKASPELVSHIERSRRSALLRPIRNLWDALKQVIADALGVTHPQYTLFDAMMEVGTELESEVRAVGAGGMSWSEWTQTANAREELGQRPGTPWKKPSYKKEAAIGFDRDDFGDRTASAQAWLSRNWTKFITFDQMRQEGQNTAFATPLTELVNALASQEPRIQKERGEYDGLAQEFLDYSKSNPKEAEEFAELGIEATNLELDVTGGPNDLGTDNSRRWQAKARLDDLTDRFFGLSKKGQELFKRMAEFYKNKHNDLVAKSVEGILDTTHPDLDAATRAGVIKRTLAQQLTEDDEELLGKQVYHLLDKESSFHAQKGNYFPRMRYGDHVVETTDTIKDTMGGTLIAPDTVMFTHESNTRARRNAEKFVKASDLIHLNTKHVYINALTGEIVSADEAKSLNDVRHGYQVRMQTKGVYFFEDRAKAEKFKRTNPEAHDVVSDVQDRLGEGYHAHLLTGTQMEVMLHSINQREDLSKGEKDLFRSILTQAAARMLSGNRIASRRLKARKITGASHDFARNILNYGDAAARHVAMARTMPTIRKAMADMRNVLREYYGADKNKLVQIFNEVSKRIDQGTVEPSKRSKYMQDLMVLSQFTRLGSIGYSIVNGTQPWVVTAPVLGGRFGNVRAVAAITQAYNDTGFGALASGFMNTGRAIGQWSRSGLAGTDDIIGNIRKRLAKARDGADLLKMLDELVDGNAISLSAGFEVSEAIAHGRGTAGHVIAKTDRIMRQLPQAIEAINRTVTAVAAYRLAKKTGMSHEKATQFAFDTVKNTQGDYSASNAPRFFNMTLLKPAVQFKKYAQLYTYLVGDMAHRAFADASPAERRIARKQLANTFATQIAVAGALSLPGLELIKAGFIISAALGLSGGWDDQEERLRQIADESFGKYWSELITRGVLTRAMDIDVSQRLSAADLWLFGEPRDNSTAEILSWLFTVGTGSTGTMIFKDWREGLQKIAAGDWSGWGQVLPLKTFGDAVKAAGKYSEGKATPKEVILNTIGLKTGRQAEQQRKVGQGVRKPQGDEAERKRLDKAYRGADTAAERAKLRATIAAHNKRVGLRYRVFPNAIDEHRGQD